MPDTEYQETELLTRDPIVDVGLESLDSIAKEQEEKEKAGNKGEEWKEAFLAQQEQLAQLTDAFKGFVVAAQNPPRQQVQERAEVVHEKKRAGWRSKVKEGQDEILEEAIVDVFGGLFEERLNRDIKPALQYVVGTQEGLLEDKLASKYNDETFGFAALKEDTDAYRKASGFNVDAESAYKRVAFDRMMGATMEARQELSKRTRKSKQEVPVDEGGFSSNRADNETSIDSDEQKAARFFFGMDEKSGKSRSQKEVDSMWLHHRKAADAESGRRVRGEER